MLPELACHTNQVIQRVTTLQSQLKGAIQLCHQLFARYETWWANLAILVVNQPE